MTPLPMVMDGSQSIIAFSPPQIPEGEPKTTKVSVLQIDLSPWNCSHWTPWDYPPNFVSVPFRKFGGCCIVLCLTLVFPLCYFCCGEDSEWCIGIHPFWCASNSCN